MLSKKLEMKTTTLAFVYGLNIDIKKFSNRISEIIKINKNFSLFQTKETKGDIFSIISRKILKKIGKISMQRNPEKYRHDCIIHLTKKI